MYLYGPKEELNDYCILNKCINFHKCVDKKKALKHILFSIKRYINMGENNKLTYYWDVLKCVVLTENMHWNLPPLLKS